MPRVKQLAVRQLEILDFGSVETKLQMAQDLGVQEWFSSAMQMLVTRREPLKNAEYQVLNQDHLLQVLDLRERAHSRQQRGSSRTVTQLRISRGEVPITVDLSARLAALVQG